MKERNKLPPPRICSAFVLDDGILNNQCSDLISTNDCLAFKHDNNIYRQKSV